MLVEISQRALCLLVCSRCLFVCMPIVLAASLFVWLRVGLSGGCAQFDHVNGGNQRFGQSVAGEKNTRLMKSLHHIAQPPFPPCTMLGRKNGDERVQERAFFSQRPRVPSTLNQHWT